MISLHPSGSEAGIIPVLHLSTQRPRGADIQGERTGTQELDPWPGQFSYTESCYVPNDHIHLTVGVNPEPGLVPLSRN